MPAPNLSDHPERDIDGSGMAAWAVVSTVLLAFLLKADALRLHAVTQTASSAALTTWERTLSEPPWIDQEIADVIRPLLKRLEEVRQERNALVHGLWRRGPTPATAIVNTLRLGRRELKRDEPITVPDLDDLQEKLVQLLVSLQHLGRRLGYFPFG